MIYKYRNEFINELIILIKKIPSLLLPVGSGTCHALDVVVLPFLALQSIQPEFKIYNSRREFNFFPGSFKVNCMMACVWPLR